MAMKGKESKPVVVKNPTKCKVIVEQGRSMGSPIVPYKVLYTEVVADSKVAKERVNQLKEEYKETDALSVHYFSL